MAQVANQSGPASSCLRPARRLWRPVPASGETDAVLDDVVELAVAQRLRRRQAHVSGRFGIQAPADFGVAAAVVGVAERTVIGEVGARAAASTSGVNATGFCSAFAARHCEMPEPLRHERFRTRRLIARAEPVPDHDDSRGNTADEQQPDDNGRDRSRAHARLSYCIRLPGAILARPRYAAAASSRAAIIFSISVW